MRFAALGLLSGLLLILGSCGNGTENATFIAVDVETGRELWRVRPPMAGVGPPSATEGLVLLQGGDDCNSPSGMLVAFNAETGREQWRVDAPAGCGAASSVALGVVVVLDLDGVTLRGLEVETGDQLWAVPWDPSSLFLVPGEVGDAVLATDVAAVRAFDRQTGQQRWTVDIIGPHPPEPPLANATTVFVRVPAERSSVAQEWCVLRAVDAEAGTERWHVPLGPYTDMYCALVVGDRAIVGCARDKFSENAALTAWDSQTGRELWTRTAEGIFCDFSFSVSFGDSVYIGGEKSETLEAIDAFSGTPRWQLSAASLDYGRPVAADDHALVVMGGTKAYILDTQSGARLGEVALPNSPCCAPAVTIGDGNLYISLSGQPVEADGD